jgi:hypothetical protein
MEGKPPYEEIELRIKELEKYMAKQTAMKPIDTSVNIVGDTAVENPKKDHSG